MSDRSTRPNIRFQHRKSSTVKGLQDLISTIDINGSVHVMGVRGDERDVLQDLITDFNIENHYRFEYFDDRHP